MKQRPHEQLIAWQKAYQLCLAIYKITSSFPAHERYALAQQMRKSAYSAPFNVAEGNSRRTSKDKAHFLDIALASLEELHCQIKLSIDLGYMQSGNLQQLDDQISLTSFFITKLRKSLFP